LRPRRPPARRRPEGQRLPVPGPAGRPPLRQQRPVPAAMRLRALLGASATVTAATVVVNLLSYAVVAVGTRALGSSRYGELAALLGLLLVGTVPALTLQVVVARRVAAGESGGLGRASLGTAAAVAVVGLAFVPALRGSLHISVRALVFMVLVLPVHG